MLKRLLYGIGIIAFLLLSFYLVKSFQGNVIRPPFIFPPLLPSQNPTFQPPTGIPENKAINCGRPGEGAYDKDFKCPPGCVNYGVPLGCVPIDFYNNCQKTHMCAVCLSSSTKILTNMGNINVKNLTLGVLVWTKNKNGEMELQPIIKLSSMDVGTHHKISRIIFVDGRSLEVSPSHPTTDGRTAGKLKNGDQYEHSIVKSNDLVQYSDTKTYDLLPAGDTGYYFADGVLMGSTLK